MCDVFCMVSFQVPSTATVKGSGISGCTLESLEEQLRKDVLAEAKANNGRILLRWQSVSGMSFCFQKSLLERCNNSTKVSCHAPMPGGLAGGRRHDSGEVLRSINIVGGFCLWPMIEQSPHWLVVNFSLRVVLPNAEQSPWYLSCTHCEESKDMYLIVLVGTVCRYFCMHVIQPWRHLTHSILCQVLPVSSISWGLQKAFVRRGIQASRYYMCRNMTLPQRARSHFNRVAQ